MGGLERRDWKVRDKRGERRRWTEGTRVGEEERRIVGLERKNKGWNM